MVADTNSPLVERVARALCAHDFRKRYGEAADHTAEVNWTLFTPIARVAMEVQSDLITRLSSLLERVSAGSIDVSGTAIIVGYPQAKELLADIDAALNAVRSDTRQEGM